MKHKKLTITAASLLAALTTQVQAGFYDWLGTTSDDWSDSSNWQNGATLGASDTARIYNSLTSTDPTLYNTVLKSGASVTLERVWLGRQGVDWVGTDGDLTIESTATLTTTGDFIISQESSLTSSGAISVGNANGVRVIDSGAVTLNSGSTLNKLSLQGNSTATLEAGSTVDTIANPAQNSQLTLNSTYSSNLTIRESSTLILNGTLDGNLAVQNSASLTVNGTVNGDIDNTSTSILNIGAGGTVNGVLEVQSNEQVTVAGNVNGLFRVNGTGQAIIESTANILSDIANGSTWINGNCSIQWNVGVDGSIGTLKSNVNESSLDAYDGEWIYQPTDNSMVVDLSAYVPDGDPIFLQPVSGLQFADREAGFVSNLEFIRNGEDISGDFTYEGDGTFSATILPDSYSTDTDADGLMDNVETNTGTFVDATDTGTDPNDTDSDDDGLNDGVETGTGLYVSATDTGTDPNVADSDSDGMSDYDEVLYLGLDPNTDSTAAINLLPSTGGGIEQSVYDAVVAELANAREARAGSTVIDVANDVATITLTVEQTSDVNDWSTGTSSDHDIELSAPAGASFYRFTIPE